MYILIIIILEGLILKVLYFYFFYWTIVDLQCCANFCFTAKWPSHTYIYILFFFSYYPPSWSIPSDWKHFPHIIPHHGLSHEIGSYRVGPHCASVLNVKVCIYLPQTPSPSHFSSPSPW